METINLTIISSEKKETFDVPNNIGLNLMEFLKASDYHQIEGTCGGMALCATCHVKVISASPALKDQSDDEGDMLDTLPTIFNYSRLACQVKLNESLQELKIELIS